MTTRPPRRRGLRPLLLALVAAAALALPGSAPAAGWTSFSSVPTSGATISAMQFAADPGGNQVAVWVEQPSPYKVMAAFRPAGGVWGAAQTLDSGTATAVPKLDVAVDAAGNFIVLFTQVVTATSTSQVFSAYLPSGQTTFGGPQAFGNPLVGAVSVTGIAVAMDKTTGTAYAVYGISTANAVGGFRPAGAGSKWTLASSGLPASSSNAMDLVVGTDGVPTLVDGQTTPRFTRFNGTNWVALTVPAAVGSITGTAAIMADPGGATTAVFQVASTVTELYAQRCPAGTAPAPTCAARSRLTLSTITSAVSPSFALDPSGNGVAAWTEGPNVVYSRRTGSLGAWSAGVQIGTGGNPSVTLDPSGDSLAAFTEGQKQISYLAASPGNAFVPPASNASDPAQGWNLPILASDGAGNGYGAWQSTSGNAIQTAVYDAEAPAAPSLSAPASATAGDILAFTASSSDRWSGVSYSWDFGDGAAATGGSVTHSYTAPGNYLARVTATDGGGNTSTQTRTIAVAAAPVPGLPRPVAGRTVNLEPVSGRVLVEVPGSNRFVPLVSPTQVRDGSIIDARKGRVRITIDNGRGGLDTAEFYGGIFRFTQPRVKAGQTWFANLYLVFGSFKGCPKAPKNPKVALAARNVKQGRSVRHLWGSGKGAFRTVGRFSSATVRGTTWLTDDRCNGTLTKVTAGKVGVRDFVLRKTVLVRKGKSYFAAAKR